MSGVDNEPRKEESPQESPEDTATLASQHGPGKQLTLGIGGGAGLCAGMAAPFSGERVGLAPIRAGCVGERDAWGEAAFCWEANDLGFNTRIEHRGNKKAFKILECGPAFQFVCMGLLHVSPNPTPFLELRVLVDFRFQDLALH